MSHSTVWSIVLLVICVTTQVFSQSFSDDFSDGDFLNNPAWSGNPSLFVVNANKELQLNDIQTNTASLYAPVLLADTAVWEFYVRLEFDPSTSNYARVYLASDNPDFSGSLNGFFVKIGGESGALDAVELYKRSGTSNTLLIRSTDGLAAVSPTLRVRVTRTQAGAWTLEIDPTGGTSFAVQGTANDATPLSGSVFGVWCNYTSTRATSFFFDDFKVAPLFTDVMPPKLLSATATSANSLDVLFSEPLDVTTAQLLSNYTVNGGIGQPTTAVLDAYNPAWVHLNFGSTFTMGQPYTVTAQAIKDLAGNAMPAPMQTAFSYIVAVAPQPFDLLITELLPDPSPVVGLPEAEFVELYNRSNQYIQLGGCTLSDPSTTALLPSVIIPPQQYIIVCRNADTTLYNSFGATAGVSTLPSLNNDGDELTLASSDGTTIHYLAYSSLWYYDNTKDEGGYSLEMINTTLYCKQGDNWHASNAAQGGTPGQTNSVQDNTPDNQAPTALYADALTDTQVRIVFGEPLLVQTAENIANYSGVGTILNAVLEQGDTSVLLELASPLVSGSQNTLNLTNITDCVGNSLSTTLAFTYYFVEAPTYNQIVVNEVLFNPIPGGVDFVELYNNTTDTYFNVGDLSFAYREGGELKFRKVETRYILAPDQYVVLTTIPDQIKALYTTTNPTGFIEFSLPSYNDDADSVIVKYDTTLIDQFNYTEDYHFALLESPEGVSLERVNPTQPTQSSANWQSAAQTVGYATPAYRNSQYQTITPPTTNDHFSLVSDTFSPDSDGNQDFLSIQYQMPATGNLTRIKIFDAKGRIVRTLANNILLSTEGILTWDGILDDHTTKARIGIYILAIEWNDANGNKGSQKLSCILAGNL
jgi:hypothetical protein